MAEKRELIGITEEECVDAYWSAYRCKDGAADANRKAAIGLAHAAQVALLEEINERAGVTYGRAPLKLKFKSIPFHVWQELCAKLGVL